MASDHGHTWARHAVLADFIDSRQKQSVSTGWAGASRVPAALFNHMYLQDNKTASKWHNFARESRLIH